MGALLEEKKTVIYLKASELKKGMVIINVGIVKSVEEYANSIVISIASSRFMNALDEIQVTKHQYLWIESVDGSPVINRTYF